MKFAFSLIIGVLFSCHIWAQKPLKSSIFGHSHNDYAQKYPFKTAFDAHMGSIEADVFLINNDLYVAHETKDIKPTNTLEDLYLKPIIEAIQAGKAYPMILLIDIKSQADSTLDVVVQQIARYPSFLNEKCPVQFIISGNRPPLEKWATYPSFIQFDGRPNEIYTTETWQRVGIVSQSFDKYTFQKGQKEIDNSTFEKMKSMVEAMHTQGKRVRFWATPDTKSVWKALTKMGVDFINTDKPKRLKTFLNKY